MKLLAFVTLFLFTFSSHSEDLRAFEAKYDITRAGKKTGEQITKLTHLNQNLWRLEDQIKGTNGMASLIGFSRSEITDFEYKDGQFNAKRHTMLQKAAFSKKVYQFIWDETKNHFEVKHKGKDTEFKPVNQNIISAQMMPLALSMAACLQQPKLTLNVLKSKWPKTYDFVFDQTTHTNARRVYDAKENKSSQVWFDKRQNCLPIKQSHKDNDEPEIITTLVTINWL